MSVNERFNLFWITRALTISCQFDQERYYYDTIHHNLFSIIKLQSESIVLDRYNLRYDNITEADISVRMALSVGHHSSIIEIPRLSVNDKKEIQFGFLSLSADKLHYGKCILAVSEQTDEDGFVLDALFHRRHTLTPHWEALKLQLSFGYMSRLNQNLAQAGYLHN
jgi:hypothetical protein